MVVLGGGRFLVSEVPPCMVVLGGGRFLVSEVLLSIR